MLIVSTVLVSGLTVPAAVIVPPEDVVPLFSINESLPSRVIVNVPVVGFPGAESTMLGLSAVKPEASPS
jgi:hypothetical protein